MAKKKVSDTIAQQRKAREDFLALKKLQNGEITPEPKPSEMAIEPKTFSEKLKNFWFHYKWHTFATVFITVTLAVLISQCASRTDYDMKVVYFTYKPVLDDQLKPVAKYLETLCDDINGDNEVNIQVINCSTSKDGGKTQYGMGVLQKLQSIIAAEKEAVLYITDTDSIEYFTTASISDFFADGQTELSEEFYNATESENFGPLPEGLQIACRRVSNTTIENDKNVSKIEQEAIKILSQLEKK